MFDLLVQERVAQAQEPKSCWRRLINSLSCCPHGFYINNKVNPVDDGVLEHMVHITTSISSPVIATACRTVCPGSPPCIGKRRQAVQEILRRQRVSELKCLGPDRLNNYKRFFQNSRILFLPKSMDRRASLQPQLLNVMATVVMRRASLLPLNMLRRSSVRPGIVVPKVILCKAPPPNFMPGKLKRSNNNNQLQIPKWNYKMKKIERRQEEERQSLLPLVRRRWRECVSCWKALTKHNVAVQDKSTRRIDSVNVNTPACCHFSLLTLPTLLDLLPCFYLNSQALFVKHNLWCNVGDTGAQGNKSTYSIVFVTPARMLIKHIFPCWQLICMANSATRGKNLKKIKCKAFSMLQKMCLSKAEVRSLEHLLPGRKGRSRKTIQ